MRDRLRGHVHRASQHLTQRDLSVDGPAANLLAWERRVAQVEVREEEAERPAERVARAGRVHQLNALRRHPLGHRGAGGQEHEAVAAERYDWHLLVRV